MGDRNRSDARRMPQSRRHGMVPIASFLENITVKAGHCGAVAPMDAILHSVRANPGTCDDREGGSGDHRLLGSDP